MLHSQKAIIQVNKNISMTSGLKISFKIPDISRFPISTEEPLQRKTKNSLVKRKMMLTASL